MENYGWNFNIVDFGCVYMCVCMCVSGGALSYSIISEGRFIYRQIRFSNTEKHVFLRLIWSRRKFDLYNSTSVGKICN